MWTKSTVDETQGLNDSDIFVTFAHVNNNGFVSGVKNKSSATDFNFYEATDGNWYAESGDQRRKSESGVKCQPFIHIRLGYMGTKEGAHLKEKEFRQESFAKGLPELKQFGFENQNVK